MGDTSNYEHRGLAPRALSQIFSEVASRVEYEYRIYVSYMEIYNERIFDLLDDLSRPGAAPDFAIIDEKDGRGTCVRGLNEIEVFTEKEALNLLFGGELARTTATHKLNKRSNRSHSIFTIYVHKRQRSGGSFERIVHSKLHLVDLAGSERIKKTTDNPDGTMGDEVTRKESMAINQSLSYLEQCVVALSRKGQVHVPYRQSKLTSILKDTIGANCNTLMFACMWGEDTHLDETISTLRFASRMMKVENDASQVETIDTVALVKKQAKEIKILKQELSMHDSLAERSGMSYEPFTEEKQEQIKQILENYLSSTDDDDEDILNISSVRQMVEICKQFKKMMLRTRNELENAKNEVLVRAMSSHGLSATFGEFSNGLGDISNNKDSKAQNGENNINIGKVTTVGALDESRNGFVLGTAASDAKPVKPRPESSSMSVTNNDLSINTSVRDKSFFPDLHQTHGGGTPNGKLFNNAPQNQLFERFTRSDGIELYQSYMENKQYVKDLKQKLKEIAAKLNDSKQKIDQINTDLENKKLYRAQNPPDKRLAKNAKGGVTGGDVVDDEEFRLLHDLKDVKQSYKMGFVQYEDLKRTLESSQLMVDQIKTDLVDSFIDWSNNNGMTNSSGILDGTGKGFMSTGYLLTPQKGAGQGLGLFGSISPPDDFNANGMNKSGYNDTMDDQEAFDLMEEQKILAEDPDSLPFFNAQKTKKALMLQNNSAIKHLRKTKRQR